MGRIRVLIGSIVCLMVVTLVPGSAVADGVSAGEYVNCVVTGRTDDGDIVSLTAGTHEGFPVPGINWDNLVLRVGDTGYAWTDTSPVGDRLVLHRYDSWWGTYLRVHFDGEATEVPLGEGPAPVVESDGSSEASGAVTRDLSVSLFFRASNIFDDSMLLRPDSLVERATEVLPLRSWRLDAITSTIRVDGSRVDVERSSLNGHVERGDGFHLNPPVERAWDLPLLLAYDYRAGARPGRGLKVVSRGRVFANSHLDLNGDGLNTGVPASFWITLRGNERMLRFSPSVDLVSEVRIGPLVLERRLVTFNDYGSWNFWLGVREMWGLEEAFRRKTTR